MRKIAITCFLLCYSLVSSAQLKADFTYDDPACEGDEVSFYDKTTGATGAKSFQWTFVGKVSGTSTSTSSQPIRVINKPDTIAVTLKVTDGGGNKDSITKTVYILKNNQASFAQVTPVCLGKSVKFDAVDYTGTVYSWDFDDGTYSSMTDPTHTFTESKVYNVKLVTKTSATNCTSTLFRGVTIADYPKINITAKKTVCLDTAFLFEFEDTTKFKPSTYVITWGDGGKGETYGDTISINNIRHSYKDTGTYNIQLIATTQYGCKDTFFHRLRVRPLPVADFTFKNACQDQPLQIVDLSRVQNVTRDPNGKIVAWSYDFGDSTYSTQQNPTHKFKGSGLFKIKLTAQSESGCVSETVGQVYVTPKPLANFKYKNTCEDSLVQFTDLSRGSGQMTVQSYKWNFGNGQTSTASNPSTTYTTPGNYSVSLIVTNDSNCIDTHEVTLTIYPKASPDFSWVGKCEGVDIQFTDKSTAPSGGKIVSWFWDFSDPTSSTNFQTVQNPKHSFTKSGTFKVRLTAKTEFGCTELIEKSVTVEPSPVTLFTNTVGCLGQTTDFADQTSGAISWAWNFGDTSSGAANTSTIKNPSHLYKKGGFYDVKLTTFNSAGCTDDVLQRIIVYVVPVADFTFKATCADSAINFQDNSTVTGATIEDWFWDFGDGNTGVGKFIKYAYGTAGTYQVSLIVTTSNGCKDTITKTVSTYPEPVADFSFNSACDDSFIQFNDQSSITGANATIASIAWDFDGEGVSSDPDPTFTFAYPGTKTVTLTAFSDKGCADRISKEVIVYPNPETDFTHTGACFGTEFEFFSTTPSPQGYAVVSYFWDFGDGSASSDQNPVHTYAAKGRYRVSLVTTTNKGCVDTAVKTVTVFPQPTADFVWQGGCTGEKVKFYDSSAIDTLTIIGWAWDFGNGFTSSQRNPEVIYGSSGSYVVTLTAFSQTDQTGVRCTSSVVTKTIQVFDPPAAGFTADSQCLRLPTQFVNTSIPSTGSVIKTYIWNFGDGGYDSVANPLHLYKAAGNYEVTLDIFTPEGCQDRFADTITVLESPTAGFTIFPNPAPIDNPHVTFTNTSQGNNTYLWDFGDNYTSTDINPQHDYEDTGYYRVKLYVINDVGCLDSLIDTVYVNMPYKMHIANSFSPNGDNVNDCWKPLGEGVVSYKIFILNRWGAEVFQSEDFNQWWCGDSNGNGQIVPEGVYSYYIILIDNRVEEVRTVKGNINVVR